MSKFMNRMVLTAMLTASASAFAQDAVANLLNELATYKYGDIRIPLREAHLWVTNALESEADSTAVAAALATLLERDTTYECKQFVCRELARVGGAAEVPALAKLLNDPETADMARIALQVIPAQEAEAALIDALDTTSGSVRAGVIDSLGARGSSEAVGPLGTLAKKGDSMEAEAAIAALGKIGTNGAARALRRAKRGASAELRAAIDDALLVCKQKRQHGGM